MGAIILREFRRFVRQRGRLLSTVARPLLWLFVVGSGFSGIVATTADLSYRDYLLPGAIGMLLASRIGSLENFAVVMNFVVFPMFFLSGALYPVARLPDVLRAAARINPLTYGVDLLKHGFFGPGRGAFGGEIVPWVDLVVLAAWTVAATLLAGWWFGREDRFTRVATSGGR